MHCLGIKLLNVLDRLPQAHRFGDGYRPGFKLAGQISPGARFEKHFANHIAAELERIHGLQQLRLAPQDPNPRRAVKLVARENQEIDPQLPHIHRPVRHTLGTIDQDQRSPGMGLLRQLADGVDRPEHVGHAGHGHEFCAVGQHVIQLRQIQLSVGGQRNESQPGTGRDRRLLPGDKVRVMFHHIEQHFVARLQELTSPAVGDGIDCGRRPAGEDDLIDTRGPDKRPDDLPGPFDLGRNQVTQRVNTPMRVRIIVGQNLGQLLDHAERLLSTRPGIQVD